MSNKTNTNGSASHTDVGIQDPTPNQEAKELQRSPDLQKRIDGYTQSLTLLSSLGSKAAKAVQPIYDAMVEEIMESYREKAMAEAKAIAESVGIKMDIVDSAPKYTNPDNASETWGGRGKYPSWLTEKIAAAEKEGKTKDDVLKLCLTKKEESAPVPEA